MPDVYLTEIISNNRIAENVCSLTFTCREMAVRACAGQFVHVRCGHSRILRRPFSICSVTGTAVRIVFEVRGDGSKWLSERRPGQTINVLGPLGKGFTFPDGDIIAVGGGIGVPPMLFAADSAGGDVTAVLGFRDKSRAILLSEFESLCRDVIVTTDDGSMGVCGSVTAPLMGLFCNGKCSAVVSCGPHAMLKAVAELCKHFGVPCQVSLEERMGCGVGACLVCACAATIDGVPVMSRVCADGPVFDAEEVVWT